MPIRISSCALVVDGFLMTIGLTEYPSWNGW